MSAPTLNRRMTSMDASFLYFEKPLQPLHIGSTSVLDGYLSREDLIDHMARRMHRIPRYRELAVFDQMNIAHPAWEPDPNFSLERHIHEFHLPPGAGQAELLQLIADTFAPMLPRDRPLWSINLIQGLPGDKSAMMSLVHHCMVDGVSGVELLQAVTDLTRDPELEEPQPYAAPPPSDPVERARSAWADAMDAAINASSDAMRRMLDPQRQMEDMQTVSRAMMSAAPAMMQPAPQTPWNRPVGGRRSYAVMPMSFGEIRAVRSVLGGTMNDVVLSTLAGGLGAYMRGHGLPTQGVELRAMIPVNVRSESDKQALGNQVSMMIAPLAVGITDAAARHTHTSARMTSLKEANQAGGFALLTRMTDSVPPGMQAFSALWTPQTQPLFNIVCTNVPGPQVPLFVRGRQLEALWPLLPLSMGLGAGCALTSYNGVLYWGLTADPDLIDDVDRMAECLGEAFEELKAEALRVSNSQAVAAPA